MKKFGILALFGVLAAGANAQFANGTIAVVSFDGGATAPVNTGMRVVLKDFSTTGTLLNSISTDTFISGTATSEGALNYADDGSHTLWIGGYQTPSTSGAIGSSTVSRRVQGYDVTGSIMGTATDFVNTTLYTANNIRSAVVVNGNLVTAGNSTTTGGTRLGTGFVAGTAPATTNYSGAVTNTREAQVWGSNMYWSTASGTTSIFTSPLAASAPTDIVGVHPTGTWSPYDFTFTNDGTNDVMYVADDGATSVNGGLLKFVKNGGTFDFAYRITVAGTVGLSGTAAGTRGLGVVNGKIYATTDTGKNILEITDGGSAALSTVSVIATAGANENFRGLEVVPEPASFAVLGLGIAGLVARKRRLK